MYEQYSENFDIRDGRITQENIDEVYFLSFVLPGCQIHLSKHAPEARRVLEEEGLVDDLFLREEPRGTYHHLEADATYFMVVEQEPDQRARDQASAKASSPPSPANISAKDGQRRASVDLNVR